MTPDHYPTALTRDQAQRICATHGLGFDELDAVLQCAPRGATLEQLNAAAAAFAKGEQL